MTLRFFTLLLYFTLPVFSATYTSPLLNFVMIYVGALVRKGIVYIDYLRYNLEK